MSLAFDEYGRPFIIINEQASKRRLKGVDAIKSNILAARSVAATLRTSLGPKGLDKMLITQDGQVNVSNDGATIVELMDIVHPAAKLLVELSQSQDNEIGDGTTGVVVFAGALLEQATKMLEIGLHPLQVADGFEQACEMALQRLDQVSETVDINADDHQKLKQAAMTALGSKVVSKYQEKFAEIARDAVLEVADLERNDVNFDLIKIAMKTGGCMEDSQLVSGIVLDKDISHPQMMKEFKDAKLLILTCPFEPPKPKTKHTINITSADDYKQMYQNEQDYFVNMVNKCKDSGATIVMCQWGFDDEANHLLLQAELPAVRWVGGIDIELLAMATGARIIPRFEEITPEKLGHAGCIRELSFGNTDDKVLIIEECKNTKAVTILVRGGSQMICEEVQRSVHDALCVVRNLIKDNRIVYGGGSAEMACSIYLNEQADTIPSVQQYAVRAFAEALEQIPTALAENTGLNPIPVVAEMKARQISDNNPRLGVNCFSEGTTDMRDSKVFETYMSKRQQIQLATQVVKMILKIDDIIAPDELN